LFPDLALAEFHEGECGRILPLLIFNQEGQ
jgi:hypothetical protein